MSLYKWAAVIISPVCAGYEQQTIKDIGTKSTALLANIHFKSLAETSETSVHFLWIWQIKWESSVSLLLVFRPGNKNK